MMRAVVWESSLVLISSDHPYRNSRRLDGKSDPRVPFLVKLPGPVAALGSHKPLQTIVSRQRGKLRTMDDLVARLATVAAP